MPNTAERLKKTFSSALKLKASEISDKLSYRKVKAWDSLAHMRLVSAIEEEFSIMMKPDDIIDMSSFAKAKKILSGYGVKFESKK